MQLPSRRRSGPLIVREFPRVCFLEICKGGQQRLENNGHWLRLLAAYSALTGVAGDLNVTISASVVRMAVSKGIGSCSSAFPTGVEFIIEALVAGCPDSRDSLVGNRKVTNSQAFYCSLSSPARTSKRRATLTVTSNHKYDDFPTAYI